MRMAERVDPDAADEVEKRVAVDVGYRASLGVVDDDAGLPCVSLKARSDDLVFAFSERATLRSRHFRDELCVLIRRVRRLRGGHPSPGSTRNTTARWSG